MSKLILSFEGSMLKTVELDKERTTIGRRPDNDVQVDNLAVSGLHAVVTTIHNDSLIKDMDSTNGTVVNGELVKKHLLQHGDAIEIGKHTIKYIVETAAAKAFEEYPKTMLMSRPKGVKQARDMEALQPLPSMPPPPLPPVQVTPPPVLREAALQVLSGPAVGKVMELNKSLSTIGKTGVQIAVFTKRPTGFYVTHVEGNTFPLVNGISIGAHAQQLHDQDTVEVAGTKMAFFYKD